MTEIKTLLVANRGEIACRIMRTANRLGIRTIAVYSTADKSALHVTMANDAICIGDPPPASSYLNVRALLAAASAGGADAIHPGYGFLAESPEFADACKAQGFIFIGPPASAMRTMALKGVARAQMEQAGVPVLPGINNVTEDVDTLATTVGYPLLIKPEAGGGGKGMKIVRHASELDAALASAKREALSSFGSDALMIEKYLTGPRHIEIQVFADKQGHCIHLNERDCSLQRRHQKIIEESPAPGLSDATRKAMGEAAITAARAIGYEGAGTVEFLLADNEEFYFMEMNTRLQVEHPVTEAVTGYDLVEWQLKIAAGESLPVTQEAVPLRGHSMEARLYAEDPLNQFLPVAGKLVRLGLPPAGSIRIDSGVVEGDEVSVYYDPMLMKLIAYARNREDCLDQLQDALEATRVSGIRTNRDLLCHILEHEPFQTGSLGTDYLDHHLPDIFAEVDTVTLDAFLCGAALVLSGCGETHKPGLNSPFDNATNFRLNASHTNSIDLSFAGRVHRIRVDARKNHFICTIDNREHHANLTQTGTGMQVVCDGEHFDFTVYRHDYRLTLVSRNRTFDFSLPLEEIFLSEDAGNVQAPMSGKVIAILVSEGDEVVKGQSLAVIEAMKMEHTVQAPADGVVGSIHYSVSDLIDEGLEMLDFVPKETGTDTA